MISMLHLEKQADRARVEALLQALRLDPAEVALNRGEAGRHVAAVEAILADVAKRGDEAVAELSRKVDDPAFTVWQIRVSADQMLEAPARVPADQLAAVRRSIAQVREYQAHVMPK